MKREKHYLKVGIEIFLIVSMTFAVSFFIYESDKNSLYETRIEQKNILLKAIPVAYEIIVKALISDKNLVSAETLSVYTCLKAKDGSICQEYASASECQSNCDSCIPTPRNKVSECRLGTCYDKVEGTCQANSPKSACEDFSGEWNSDPNANIPQCRQGCCLIGDQAFFATSQECKRKADVLGREKTFRPEINTELSCLILANSQEEGACVFEHEFENTCKFTSKASCLTMHGDFYAGFLCSNPELETNCKPQVKSQCVDGKDEIYWFDSCGNKENIYDANKVRSYNDGRVLSKQESCSLGTDSNPLSSQGTCGNCNYLQASRCGQETASEKLADVTQDAVCRDLRCKDENGKIRLNGESWCAYNSAIGVDGSRSIDTPGSRHFRQVCIDAEVRTEACADYRNEICVESQSPISNGASFSSAACRINKWQQCLDYNTQVKSKNNPGGITQEERNDKCETNPDCFVKKVNIDKNFKFNICAPKYPAGFDLSSNGEGAEGICSMASQKCTVIYVKGFSGWKCKANCHCEDPKFAEQMNDLCISLGDCGASVNYQGDFTENYKVTKTPKLKNSYIQTLKTYSDPIKNKIADPGNISGNYGELGIPEGLGDADYKPIDASEQVKTMAMISGAAGVGLVYAVQQGIAIPGFIQTSAGSPVLWAGNPQFSAFGGALAGAAIGFAATALLIKYLGIGAGLDPVIAYGLMTAGAVGGAIVGYAAVTGGTGGGLFAGATLAGPIILAVVLVAIVVMKLLGVGDTKKKVVSFSCNAWQPPLGGDKCSQCGQDNGNAFNPKDGSTSGLTNSKLACSKYACQSLGQTCEFINEGTGQEQCVNINPNDASAPVIKPLQSALKEGFSYVESIDGFKVKSDEEDGCIKAYQPLTFGIALNEPGRCKMDIFHTNSFDEMEFDFGGRSLFMYNHTAIFSVPSLESLGITGYDPNRKADYNLYVRCQDKVGNKNIKEYAINFCVKPGDDSTPPIISARLPSSEYVKFSETQLAASIFVNEPSECKWDIEDKDYDIMSNQMQCNTDIESFDLLGWQCDSNFPVSEAREQAIFIRCKDQPWLIEDAGTGHSSIVVNEGNTGEQIVGGIGIGDESEEGDNINGFNEVFVDEESQTRIVEASPTKHRNKNMQSYRYVIKKNQYLLNIDSISPNDENLTFGSEPVTINFEVRTSGGTPNNIQCSYLWGDRYIPFFETFSSVHKQTFETFSREQRILGIRCEDILTGETVDREAKFNILIDNEFPKITRVYEQGGMLRVITDEDSQCYYSLSQCNFDIENATTMSGDSLVHDLSFDRDRVHYIKCKDEFGNLPGICSIAVKGGVI